MSREAEARAYFEASMHRVATTPEPKGQKFPCGSRVMIAEDLGPRMRYFPGKGKCATVLHTHAHAFGGNDVNQYRLDVDGEGPTAWYEEHQLTAVDSERPRYVPRASIKD
jgi:hypothetical protein